jgi:hypothetical protein
MAENNDNLNHTKVGEEAFVPYSQVQSFLLMAKEALRCREDHIHDLTAQVQQLETLLNEVEAVLDQKNLLNQEVEMLRAANKNLNKENALLRGELLQTFNSEETFSPVGDKFDKNSNSSSACSSKTATLTFSSPDRQPMKSLDNEQAQ